MLITRENLNSLNTMPDDSLVERTFFLDLTYFNVTSHFKNIQVIASTALQYEYQSWSACKNRLIFPFLLPQHSQAVK